MKAQDFLNPTSMLTPGIAGALMMFIVNGLLVPFPELPPRWVALAVSFAIGAAIACAANTAAKGWHQAVLWVLNSLIIFAMGFGTNSYVRDVTEPAGQAAPSKAIAFVLPVAYAQTQAPPGSPKESEKKEGASASGQPGKEQASATRPRAPDAQEKTPRPQRDPRFFKKW